MSNFKVGDKVVRSDMDLDYVPSSYVGIFKEKVPLTVKAIKGPHLIFKEIGLSWVSRKFELYEDTSKHHKHHDQIIAWAKGTEIEYLDGEGNWQNPLNKKPNWFEDVEYRIKPTEKSNQQQKIDHIESEMRKLVDQLNELKGS